VPYFKFLAVPANISLIEIIVYSIHTMILGEIKCQYDLTTSQVY